jgi:hypothetical protein
MTHPVKPAGRAKAGMAVINAFDGSIKRLRLAAPVLAD